MGFLMNREADDRYAKGRQVTLTRETAWRRLAEVPGGPSQPPAAPAALRWPCSDLQGAFAGLIVGLLLGLIRLILDFIYTQPQCHQLDERPAVVKDVHYLYFSTILSAVTLVTMSAVSWLTEPPSTERVHLGLMLDPLRPLAARDRKGPHWGVRRRGCRLRGPVRTRFSRCLFSRPARGWQLLGVYPL